MLIRLVQVVTVTVVRRTRRLGRGATNLLRPARTAAALVSAASLDAVRLRSEVMAENAFLRQQILVLRRAAPRRPRLHREDRLLLVLLAGLDHAWRGALLVVQPDTLLRWHRDLFTLVWRRKSRRRDGPRRLRTEVVDLIRTMATAGIVIDYAVFACAVDEQGEFASRRRNGFRFADAGRQASIERAEGRLGATQAHRGQAQDRRGPVGRGLRPGTEEATARDLVLRRQGEPRGEMFPSRPAAHVGADLGDETQRTVRANGMELREIDASELLEGAADVEAGFVAPGLRGRPRRRECACGRGGRGPEGLQVGLGRRVTGSQLVLNHVEQLQVLPQREEVLRPIVSGEGGGDLRFGGAAAMIPLLGEVVGIRAPGDDGSQNTGAP